MANLKVISCSRRTDIPHYYAGWLEERLNAGEVTFRTPRGAVCSVSLTAESVHSIVLWSKCFGPLLQRPALTKRLKELNPYFHFTITGLGGTMWEPDIPAWPEAVKQMERLVSLFGSERVNWRFDPVIHWQADDRIDSNLALFSPIGEAVAKFGITTCTFSFAQWYNKSRKRTQKAGLPFVDPAPEEKVAAAKTLASKANELGIALASCADDTWLVIPGITKASCVNGSFLSKLRPGMPPAPQAKDPSQRSECGCTRSIDIGSYAQRCGGRHCVYCYAN